jgi:hypothetical protein
LNKGAIENRNLRDGEEIEKALPEPQMIRARFPVVFQEEVPIANLERSPSFVRCLVVDGKAIIRVDYTAEGILE